MKRLPEEKATHDFPLPKLHNAYAENSYRRGFYQGVVAAEESLLAGLSMKQIGAWRKRLRAWRSKNHKGIVERPEWLSRDEK
jgi:hypothetical protein